MIIQMGEYTNGWIYQWVNIQMGDYKNGWLYQIDEYTNKWIGIIPTMGHKLQYISDNHTMCCNNDWYINNTRALCINVDYYTAVASCNAIWSTDTTDTIIRIQKLSVNEH